MSDINGDRKRVRKGMGRVEIIACAGKIEELLSAGHTVRYIYENLKNKGVITLSYCGFYEAFRYRDTRKLRRSQVSKARTSVRQRPDPTTDDAQISGPAAPPPLNLGNPIPSKSSDELMEEFRVLNESREQERAKRRRTSGPKLERSSLAQIDKSFGGDE